MDKPIATNGHHPAGGNPAHTVNAYVDAISGEQPREIVEFEMASDPYANMLPGVSNIKAARTITDGVWAGRRGSRWLGVVSLIVLSLFVLAVLVGTFGRPSSGPAGPQSRIPVCSPAFVSADCVKPRP